MKLGRLVADPGTLLARALVASAVAAGCEASVTAIDTHAWASATFVGARHQVAIAIPASIARYRWLAHLAEADLPMRGHVALPPAILSADGASVFVDVITLEAH